MKSLDQKRQIQELLLLQRSAQKINSILDLDTLLEEIVNDVSETFGYLRAGVLLKDDEANELEIAAVRGWTKNYHIKGDRFKIGVYGIIGHVAATKKTYYAPDVTIDPYYKVSEESTRSEVDIPLIIKDRLIGVFSLQHHEKNAFDQERIQLLESLAAHIAIAIENARLFRNEKMERERISNELKDARNIQLHLFPQKSPSAPGFKISGICLPCLEAGGDWFDYISFDDGKVGIVLADVSGKGMGAALLMSSTRSILRLVALNDVSPDVVLKKVNELLIKDFPTARFVTMIYAVLDPINKTITMANAGHLYPIHKNSDDIKLLESKSGLPLGITHSNYDVIKLELHSGDKLVFYTDGVTEAMDRSNEEFGINKLLDAVKKESLTVNDVVHSIEEFAAGTAQSDDITVVMIDVE
jgi:sigma-B regulation protein RsbU (phosphoserine phosphatase)